jgi:glycerol-3-phosphate acyltransferase PlsX
VEGTVDVIVADGYSGNIFLKTMEGTGLFLAREIKKMFKKNFITKLAALMVAGGLKNFKKLMSSDEVGGTALVGISKPVIKAHGSSDAYAIKNAIRAAEKYVSSGIIENIAENVDVMRLEPTIVGEEKAI